MLLALPIVALAAAVVVVPGAAPMLAGTQRSLMSGWSGPVSQLACGAIWVVVALSFVRDAARNGARADLWSALMFIGLAQSRGALALGGAATPWLLLSVVLRLEGLLVGVVGLNREMRDEMLEAQVIAHRLRAEYRANELVVAERRHDVRASLFAIQSSAMALDQQHLGHGAETIVTFARAVCAEAARLERLVGGAEAPATVAYDVVEVIEPLVTCDRMLGQDIEVRIPCAPVHASGNPDAAAEIIRNLLDNARRHAPGAPVTVTVSAAGREVRITVSDDGPGVADADRQLIFEPGYRGNVRGGGSGLGLHSARRLCREQGGDLVFEQSTVGSAFTMVLPAAATPSVDLTRPAAAAVVGHAEGMS